MSAEEKDTDKNTIDTDKTDFKIEQCRLTVFMMLYLIGQSTVMLLCTVCLHCTVLVQNKLGKNNNALTNNYNM